MTLQSATRWDAREYLRVSKDKSGQQRSTDEQHDENAEAAADREWSLGPAYADPDYSASKYARRARPDYAKLIGDLETGAFSARVLILWESSRGSRRTGEWVTLIELCEDQGVKIFVTTHDRLYDPANPRDRKALLEDAIGSEYASAETSKRVRRSTKAAALQGRPHGQCPYGYRRTYGPHPDTGKVTMLEQLPEPHESPNIEDLFTSLDAGESFNSIERRWEADGVRRRDGGVFSDAHLRKLATNPAYAGLRLYSPGRTPKDSNDLKSGTLIDGSWPGIVDRELFDRVQRMLRDPARRTSRGGAAKHLLSMIAVAGPCGGELTGLEDRGRWIYRCAGCGCIKIGMAQLNEEAGEILAAYLSREDNAAALDLDGDAPELERVRGRIATIEGELRELEAQLKARQITITLAGAAETEWRAELDDLETQRDALEAPSALRGLADIGDDILGWWLNEDIPVSARREVARVVFAPDVLGALTVYRSRDVKPGEGRVRLVKVDG